MFHHQSWLRRFEKQFFLRLCQFIHASWLANSPAVELLSITVVLYHQGFSCCRGKTFSWDANLYAPLSLTCLLGNELFLSPWCFIIWNDLADGNAVFLTGSLFVHTPFTCKFTCRSLYGCYHSALPSQLTLYMVNAFFYNNNCLLAALSQQIHLL